MNGVKQTGEQTMNFDELAKNLEFFLQQGLQDKGVEKFADMCLSPLYQDYAIPDTVSYLVLYPL